MAVCSINVAKTNFRLLYLYVFAGKSAIAGKSEKIRTYALFNTHLNRTRTPQLGVYQAAWAGIVQRIKQILRGEQRHARMGLLGGAGDLRRQ